MIIVFLRIGVIFFLLLSVFRNHRATRKSIKLVGFFLVTYWLFIGESKQVINSSWLIEVSHFGEGIVFGIFFLLLTTKIFGFKFPKRFVLVYRVPILPKYLIRHLIIAITEETIWRGIILFTVIDSLNCFMEGFFHELIGVIIGVGAVTFFFVKAHPVGDKSYNQVAELYTFFVIVSIAMYFTKSLVVAIAMHWARNIILVIVYNENSTTIIGGERERKILKH